MSKLKTVFIFLTIISKISSAQGTWAQKANYSGSARYSSVAFSIGDKGYILTGTDADSLRSDMWEYDTMFDTWTRKANFAGSPRQGAVGFSIGSKGYVGTGQDQDSLRSDFWEYDPISDTWTQKANFGGTPRFEASGFSIGTKGYIGTGADFMGGPGNTNDFWEYDQQTDSWSQKANLIEIPKRYSTGFSIGQKGYIFLGGESNVGPYPDEFWEWDQFTDTWSLMGSWPVSQPLFHRISPISFVIGNKAYVGTGFYFCGTMCWSLLNDLWEWDSQTNLWTQKTNFAGASRYNSVAFAINGNGYIGTGSSPNLNDFWEYCPTCTSVNVNKINDKQIFSVYPNPLYLQTVLHFENSYDKPCIKIYNSFGQQVKQIDNILGQTYTLHRDNLPCGIYFLQLTEENQIIATLKLVISDD